MIRMLLIKHNLSTNVDMEILSSRRCGAQLGGQFRLQHSGKRTQHFRCWMSVGIFLVFAVNFEVLAVFAELIGWLWAEMRTSGARAVNSGGSTLSDQDFTAEAGCT